MARFCAAQIAVALRASLGVDQSCWVVGGAASSSFFSNSGLEQCQSMAVSPDRHGDLFPVYGGGGPCEIRGDRRHCAACFFNTSSGLVNALTQDLPNRNHLIPIYTLTVFTTGTPLGSRFSNCKARRASEFVHPGPGWPGKLSRLRDQFWEAGTLLVAAMRANHRPDSLIVRFCVLKST